MLGTWKRIFTLAAIASSVAIPASASAAPPPPIEDSISTAKSQGKALVVEFYTSWCGPCKEFKAKVLPLPSVQASLGGVHFVQYDAEAGPGLAAATQYKITGYPTFLVIDSAGKVVMRQMGSLTESAFLSFLVRADMEVLNEDALNRRIVNTPYDPRLLMSAARWYRNRGAIDKALDMYRRANAADRGNKAGIAATSRWERMELRRYHNVRKGMVGEWMQFVSRYPSAGIALHALAVVSAAKTVPKARLEGLGRLIVDAIGDDASKLNRAIYALLGAGVYKAALVAAERQVALDPTASNPYDSLAEALHYNGRQADAISAAELGMALATPAMKPVHQANLARYQQPGRLAAYDVGIARHRAGSVLRQLPGLDPVAQKSAPRPKPAPSARSLATQKNVAFQRAATRATIAAGAACAKHARKLDEVYVRIEVSAQDRKPRKIVVLEPNAPRKLIRCLKTELLGAQMPEAPASVGSRLTLAVKLAAQK